MKVALLWENVVLYLDWCTHYRPIVWGIQEALLDVFLYTACIITHVAVKMNNHYSTVSGLI